MIDDLRPYPEYKQSGLPWLGSVPAHWELRRNKAILREVDRRTTTGTEPLLSLRMQAGLVDHHALGGKRIPPANLVGYKRVLPGEVVMNRMRAAVGLFAAAQVEGLVSPDYAIFRPNCQVDLAYLIHLYRTSSIAAAFRLESRGLGTGESGFLRLYSDSFGTIRVPFPPVTEQASVVRFLQWANGRLDRAIQAKRKVIGLLNDQKQAIIHRAVTRGLDPSLPLKPSGVPWLGDIPQPWEVWPVGRIGRVGNGSTPSRGNPAFWNRGTYPWLNSSQVNRTTIDSADQFVTELALRECHLPRLGPGAVLVAITGQGKTRGTTTVLEIEATINQHIAYIQPRLGVTSPQFLRLALSAAYTELRTLSDDSGSTKGALTCSDIRHFKVAIPPMTEQYAVLQQVQSATVDLVSTTAKLQREVDLLREYRTRLIADVVTGKLDVREAAAGLPADECSPELVPIAEADDSTEAEPDEELPA